MTGQTHQTPTHPSRTLPAAALPARERGLASLAEVVSYGRGAAVFHQGDPAACWHSVASGVVIQYVVRPDGRRQIIDLLLPGDFFGFTLRPGYPCSAEAVVDETVLLRYPRRRIEPLAEADADLSRRFLAAATKALARLEEHILVMGRTTAPEKVGAFLLEIERRIQHQSADVQLPVSRYDMADYLAVSVETVSRALGELKQRGRIRLAGPRAVEIVDHEALAGGEASAGLP
jgi:CRP/FNR family nitrogen fixation transcriptional regulator